MERDILKNHTNKTPVMAMRTRKDGIRAILSTQ